MYKSPIEIITGQIKTNYDNAIYSAVQNVGINVDKAELLKALEYDRGQYDKGYNDAIDDFANELHFREFDNAYGTHIVLVSKEVDHIAKGLKAGEKE